jgi:sigma-B regulation protein RsbU (phosphoserine phosphatase)
VGRAVQMNGRIWILIFLAIGALIDRGFSIYDFFFNESRAVSPPFRYTIKDNYLTVVSIRKNDSDIDPTFQAGLRENDRVIEAYNIRGKGQRIQGLFAFGSALRNTRKDEPWILLIQRPSGAQELSIILPPQTDSKPPPNDRFLQFWISIILPCIIVASAFFVGFSRPKNKSSFLACLLLLSLSSVISTSRNIYTYPAGLREISLTLQIAETALAGYFFLRFYLLFPVRSSIEIKYPRLKSAALILVLTGLATALFREFTKSISFARFHPLQGFYSFTEIILRDLSIVLFLLGAISLLWNRKNSETQDEGRRTTLLMLGSFFLLISYFVLWKYTSTEFTGASLWLAAIAVISGICFPLFLAYSVLEHRVFGMRVITRRGIQYLLESHGAYIIAAALIFTGLYLTVGAATFHLEVSATPGFGWRLGAMAALAFGLAMMLPRISRGVLPHIEQKLFADAYNAHRILRDLSRAIQRQPIKPEMLIDLAISQINRALSIDRLAVFLRGAKIVDPSPDTDETREFSIAWIRRKGVDYQCCEIRDRSESEKHRMVSAEELKEFFIPSDSLVVKEILEKLNDPRALEFYREEKNSVTNNALTSEESQSENEKSIFRQLNTQLVVPMITSKQLVGFLCLGEKPSEEPYSREEKELLLGIAYQMAVAIDYSQQSDRIAEQEKLRREIEIAKQVQSQLFPQRVPGMKTLDYMGVCKAAREVGGDYYDFMEIGPGRLGFVVADISGKGISAALLMASLQALLRSHAALHGDRAELLVWDINRLMHSSTANGKYASLFYGFYDDLSRLLAYVNAGHLPPILYKKDGSVVRLKTGGMVVGMMPDTAYRQEIVKLEPGDILLIFSDGISEAMNMKDQEFGEERLISLIAPLAELSANSISESILKSIADYVGAAPQHDDSTLVVIKAV